MSAAPRIGVLALQGDVREHRRALTEVGAEPVDVRRPEELAGIDGLVLPGGESTTIGKLLELFELLEPLRAAVKTGLPVYGSCAGMILLADEVIDGRPDQPTVGGLDIAVRRNAFGRQVDSFETDLPMVGIGEVHAVFIRAPWVERTGPGVEVLATVAAGAATGKVVAVRHGPLLATSFHPELTGDSRVHGLFVQMVKENQS
ncbi:MAG: pyridoxal 5'-phosphate synthase glutaminase subunit PdxT [Frankiaceae bacterium]|nr:pyridoxal 5'-phosphate synthase glutaminase subunit PdxT [Frankiaceae bacterium]